jgi:hypothetical protein
MKQTCIAITLFIMTYTGQAQSKVQFGVKAGANFSAWVGKQSEGTINKTGFYAGGLAVFPVSNTFVIQPELLYSNEGTKHDVVEYTTDYIRLPLLLQYRHASGFHMEAGPQLGVRVKAKMKENNSETAQDIKDMVKPVETSLVTGLGYRHPVGIGLDIRYALGLSRLGGATDLRSSVISVGLSYLFNGTK